ncbi:SDR family oxidoreductase [Jatrophihabitans sp.]|uniref:SDR family NAD(P)-dependent oxidoreductase n=1 Tax=Jatrophihabitans sp. TaxID=1932789 RepID=UPI0030C6D9B3|nr:short-chain dehydrogenase/reductase [Jatrophihabitans sp.]
MSEAEAVAATRTDYAAMLRLDGTVHVVLGAGQGIGREAALALSAAGATVVCVDLDLDRAEAVAAEVGGVGLAGDALERDSMTALFGGLTTRFDRLDGVVDIIGMSQYKGVLEFTDEDLAWHRRFNLQHALLTIQCAEPQMTASGGGCVTFVTSIAALTSAPMHAVYGLEKAGIMSLARTAAVELGPRGMRVNSVAPGLVRTPRQIENPSWTPELVQTNIDRTPLRRLAVPADVAGAILFLALPIAGHITGQAIVVDGGSSITYSVETPGSVA